MTQTKHQNSPHIFDLNTFFSSLSVRSPSRRKSRTIFDLIICTFLIKNVPALLSSWRRYSLACLLLMKKTKVNWAKKRENNLEHPKILWIFVFHFCSPVSNVCTDLHSSSLIETIRNRPLEKLTAVYNILMVENCFLCRPMN